MSAQPAPTPAAEYLHDTSTDGLPSAGDARVAVIDIGPALRDTPAEADVAAVAAALDASFRHTGFAVVTGHGIPTEVFTGMTETSKEFFDLPLAEKMEVAFPAPEVIRGYEPVPDVSGPARAPNLMESLLINRLDELGDYPPGSPEARLWRWPNLWPRHPEALRPAWERYYREMTALGDRLLELAALGLGLPPDWFADKFDHHFNNLASNHYPPQAGVLSDSPMLRNRPHTDHGALTLLYRPAEPGGLEVFADDVWWKVPFIPDSLVINIGDMLERWTNGQFKATPHRVVNATGAAADVGRHSVAYFQQPNPDAVVEPASPEWGESRFTPVIAGQHISRKELGYHTVEALGV